MGNLIAALRDNLKIYLIEAWALGMFMVSACAFVILVEHPDLPVRAAIASPLARRFLIGLAMGVTALLLIYSKWGKLSGAHMNPAVTLTFLNLDRISKINAFWYIIFQFAGGALAVYLFKWFLPGFISDPSVNYAVTVPGTAGEGIALGLEALLSLLIILTVLFSSNHEKIAPYTGWMVGLWLTVFITFEAPFSGMSINPARTVASALPGNVWTGWWLYFTGPIAAMMLGGWLYRVWFRSKHGGDCTGMKFHLSGKKNGCKSYEVLGPAELLEKHNEAENQDEQIQHIFPN
jgi:aquaporin Z